MPPVLGSDVALADALVVLCRGDGHGVPAIAEREEGELFAVEELLEDDLRLLHAKQSSAEHLCGCGLGLQMRLADHNTLAGSEPIGLDDNRNGETAELFPDLVERSADRMGSGRNLMALHELFRKGLAALKPGCCPCRSEDAHPALLQRIDQAERERNLRTHHRQGRVLDRHEIDHGLQIVHIDRNTPGDLRDPSVPRSADYFGHIRRFADGPDQGVFAPTTTDHQYLHHF